jgi:predicted permease
MNQISYLLKQAWASLKLKPGFVATVVITMGTALGALLCILTLAYLLLVEPLPYPDQNTVFKVTHELTKQSGVIDAEAFTYPSLLHLYKKQDVFEQTAMIYYAEEVLTSLPDQPTANTAYTTPEWFEILGVTMALGRAFDQTEALDTYNPVAILSYQAWQDDYEGDPNILSKKVSFRGNSYNVVGVLAKRFVEPHIFKKGRQTAIWLPWDYNLATWAKARWDQVDERLTLVGKLKGGLVQSRVEQTISALVSDIWVENVSNTAFFNGWTIKMKLKSFKSVILGESKNTVFLLLSGALGLVIIACANITNLFMSRTAEQERNLAIYATLGAKKSHIFRVLFAESSVLMFMSILLALVISVCGFYVLQTQLALVLPRVNELSLNAITIVMALILTLTFAALFAFISSRMINYGALSSILQSSGKGTGRQVSKGIRQSLVVSQVSIASVLILANISLLNQAIITINEPSGYGVDNMLQLVVSVSTTESPAEEAIAVAMKEIKTKLLQLPQIEKISHSSGILNEGDLWGLTSVATNENFTAHAKEVSPEYFGLFGQTLLEGDVFSNSDVNDQNLVLIVNDVFAKRLNPSGSAVGMRMTNGSGDFYVTIIGVVKGVLMPGATEIPLRMYVPAYLSDTQMTLKLKENQSLSREKIISVIGEVSGPYALLSLRKLSDWKKSVLFTQYTTTTTTAILAIITLFLASIGLYGILSYGTQMRRFELGTRMAIGAKRKDIIMLIVKDNAWVIALGMAASIILMLVTYIANKEIVGAYLSLDLLAVFAFTLVIISLLSLFACYWPLRQFINQPAIHSLRGND